jgi:hypothetical protein
MLLLLFSVAGVAVHRNGFLHAGSDRNAPEFGAWVSFLYGCLGYSQLSNLLMNVVFKFLLLTVISFSLIHFRSV